MAQFMNSFTWNQAPNDEFFALMPQEQENVRKLMAEGKLLHIFVAEDNSGGWQFTVVKRWRRFWPSLKRCHYANS